MPRIITRGVQVLLDLLVLSLAFWFAFWIRFEFAIPREWLKIALTAWLYAVALEYVVLTALGIPRFSWRYVSMRETVRISAACIVASVLLLLVGAVANQLKVELLEFAFLPRGVIVANCLLMMVGLIGIRATRRILGESQERRLRGDSGDNTKILLIGAGQAGVMVARELAGRPDLGLTPIGFVDDDMNKVGTQIGGLKVLGTTAQLAAIASRQGVTRGLITIANASGADIRRITLACSEAGLQTKIIPGIYEIVGEKVNLSRIREVAIEDLLGREPVSLDETAVSISISQKTVMVTGAGGSIGSELCRQVCRFSPRQILLVERFENALFEIHRELIAAYPDLVITPCIADVADSARMSAVFGQHRPNIVFHAAAHKHVPMMELNPGEAVKNNVGGTKIVADLASNFGAERFVMVSTDKAVNPTSVMGASKRIAEIYTQLLASRSKTRFVTVRFGNVLGSNGSVIPIFKEQIARGGPVTVTHPEMQRYFMTIPEASQLVLQAGAMGDGGEIFILDMGEPVKIVDLARDLITLSGFRPDEDIEIRFSGVRPGEKLFEELSTNAEHADKTKHPKIFIGRIEQGDSKELSREIEELLGYSKRPDAADAEVIRKQIASIVPEYSGAGASSQTSPSQSSGESTPVGSDSSKIRRSATQSGSRPTVAAGIS